MYIYYTFMIAMYESKFCAARKLIISKRSLGMEFYGFCS